MWEEFEIVEEDLSGFKFIEGEAKTAPEWSATWTRIHTRSTLVDTSYHDPPCDCLQTKEEHEHDQDSWGSWLQRQDSPKSKENDLNIAISGPAYFHDRQKNATSQTALSYVGLPEGQFRDILGRMKIHPLFLRAVRDSGPVATRYQLAVEGSDCVVYLLRVSNSTSRQSAIAITHFPESRSPDGQEVGSRINALILGYDQDDVSLFKSSLRQRRRTLFGPGAIIMAFLEVEKEKRFGEVRLRRSGLTKILHNVSSREAVVAAVTCPGRHRNADDNVGLYLKVSDLVVDALQPWRQQILSLKSQVDFDDPRLSSDLNQLAFQYEHRISRCDKILQGASLAYQMETTSLSRNDSSIAINDGKRMKAIALLTMIFLPATFTATLMAVPQVERALNALDVFGDAGWLWYLTLSLSFTSLVLVLYGTWSCTSSLKKARKEQTHAADLV